MVVVHLVSNKFWGGGERYVHDLVRKQYEAGNKVVICSRDIPDVAHRFAASNFDMVYAPLKGCVDFLSPFLIANSLRGTTSPVIIHAHNFKDAITALMARMLMRNRIVGVVVTRHLVRHGKNGILHKWIYRHVDKVIFVSKLAKDEFMSTYPSISCDKLEVVYNGVDYTMTHDMAPFPCSGTFRLIYCGRLTSEKGVETLLEAVSLLKNEDIRVEILGSGDHDYVEYLKQRAVTLGVDGKVCWIGHQENVHPFIEQTHIGLAPSIVRESFCLAAAECMAHGKPVITTDNGAQTEYVVDGINGLSVPPANPEALATAIKIFVDNPGLIKKMGTNAYTTFREKLSFPRFFKEINAIYMEVIHRRVTHRRSVVGN